MARAISVRAPLSARSSSRGWPKMRYFRVPKGCSKMERRSRIKAGVARWAMGCRALSEVAEWEEHSSSPVGEKAEVADAHEAAWEQMEEEAAQELING